jgi:glycerol-3-phosphate acyltransferase PlsY
MFFTLLTYLYEGPFAVRMALMMAVFLTWRHKSNLRNLFD